MKYGRYYGEATLIINRFVENTNDEEEARFAAKYARFSTLLHLLFPLKFHPFGALSVFRFVTSAFSVFMVIATRW